MWRLCRCGRHCLRPSILLVELDGPSLRVGSGAFGLGSFRFSVADEIAARPHVRVSRRSWQIGTAGRTGHHRATATEAPTAQVGRDVQRRPSPRRGCGGAENLKMAHSVIFTGCAQSHFQPTSRKCEDARETAISRCPRPFPRIWTRSRRVNIAGRSSGGRTNATTNNKPGEHLRAPRSRLLLINGFGRLFNAGCYDQGCFATSFGPYRSRRLPNCSSTPPLGIKVERSKFSSFAASRIRR